MNVLQFWVGQFGDAAQRAEVKGMLLDLTELDDGWSIVTERSWRTGVIGSRSDVGRRARRAGTFTALRRFKKEAPYRGLFVEAICCASPDDSRRMLSKMETTLIFYPRRRSSVEATIPGVVTPGTFREPPYASEMLVRTKLGTSSQKLIAGSVSNALFVVSGSGFDGGWDWADLESIATAQAAKLEARLPAF